MNARHTLHRSVRRLACDRTGLAAVEVALVLPIFMLLGIGTIDFGYAFHVKLKIANATTAAALYAQANGSSVTPASLPAFLANVQSVASVTAALPQGLTTTVAFNNATTGGNVGNFYCLSGSPPIWVDTGTTAKSCGGNVTSGKFVSIAVSTHAPSLFAYTRIFNAILALSDFAVVRVQ